MIQKMLVGSGGVSLDLTKSEEVYKGSMTAGVPITATLQNEPKYFITHSLFYTSKMYSYATLWDCANKKKIVIAQGAKTDLTSPSQTITTSDWTSSDWLQVNGKNVTGTGASSNIIVIYSFY